MVHRASSEKEANMVLEQVSSEQHVTLHMPLKKKKTQVDWEPADVPTIPILMNKKAIKEHTKLLVFLPETKKK